MKLFKRFLYVSVMALGALTSCAKHETESSGVHEKISLEAWMRKYRPELLDNYQPYGDYGFYVDVIKPGEEKAGEAESGAIGDGDCWVTFDYTSRDLNGSMILTRNADAAKLLGTFTKYTRYVPYYRYCGSENASITEGVYLTMRNTLQLGQDYYDKYKTERGFKSREIRLREGAEVKIYMPSVLVGGSGQQGSGGYEGQTSLAAGRPMIVELAVRDTVKNPLELEGTEVDGFCEVNGGVEVYKKDDPEKKVPTDPADPRHPYNPASKRWASAADTVAQLYVNYRFDPKTDLFTIPAPYKTKYEPYNNREALEQQISKVLAERFHKDKAYEGVTALKSDSVKMDGTAKIWYIGRFTDGFIFDTNIDEVKKLIYGEVKSAGSALSYTPSAGSLIQAFYYTVPKLRYGQWAALITTSTNGYGSAGKSGNSSTTTTGGSSNNMDYVNYLNYVNGYYGGYQGGYYDNYYGNYYGDYYGGGNYYGGYYDPYYGQSYENTGTSVTTVSTEIPSFSPLIFEFYIEPKE